MPPGASVVEQRVSDLRGRRVVFLSHCLLNENVRYPGGAGRPAGVQELVDSYLSDGVGVCQLPCPEQDAWGGVRKRLTLPAYGSGGTTRAPLVRLLLPLFTVYTRWRYRRLARRVARDVRSYLHAGMEVVAVVGIGGSPSCGVRTTLDLAGAVDVLTRCRVAQLDREFVNTRAIRPHVAAGAGWFMQALGRRLRHQRVSIPFEEYDLLAELGLHRESAVDGEPIGTDESSVSGPAPWRA